MSNLACPRDRAQDVDVEMQLVPAAAPPAAATPARRSQQNLHTEVLCWPCPSWRDARRRLCPNTACLGVVPDQCHDATDAGGTGEGSEDSRPTLNSEEVREHCWPCLSWRDARRRLCPDTACLGVVPLVPDQCYDAADAGGTGEDSDNSRPTLDSEEVSKYFQLRRAIGERNLSRVKDLLQAGVPLAYRHPEIGETVLSFCVDYYSRGKYPEEYTPQHNIRQEELIILQELSIAAKEAGALDLPNIYGQAPLYSAIEMGDLEIIQILASAGSSLKSLTPAGGTALHLSTRFPQILKYFLDNYNIKETPDNNGSTSIHYAAFFGKIKSMELLLEKMVIDNKDAKVCELINVADKRGDGPIHLSARRGHVDMTAFLLINGATLSVEGEKTTVAQEIVSGFRNSRKSNIQGSNPLTFLENIFDEYITVEDDDVVTLGYEVLTPYEGKSQIKVMDELVRCGLSKLLIHPLLESLVSIKWNCLLPVFRTIIVSYVLFLVLFNIFVITSFIKLDTMRNGNNNITDNNKTIIYYDYTFRTAPKTKSCIECYTWYPAIYICIFILLLQEYMWMYLQRLRYLKRLESWVSLAGLALASAVPPALGPAPAPWQRHLACLALLLTWVRLLFLLSRFPNGGYYVLMFWTVGINISKIFVMLIWLVIAFAICFMVEYQLEPPFNGYVNATMKTLVMMTSEFEYEGLFGDTHLQVNDADLVTVIFVRLLFVIFVIFIATVMMNFMIGVAVSDVNELTAIGSIKALEMQVELLSKLEGVEDIAVGTWFNKLSQIRFQKYIYNLTPSSKRWYIRNVLNGKETEFYADFTSKLQDSIFSIARKEKQFTDNKSKVPSGVIKISPPLSLEDRIMSIEYVNKEIIVTNKEITVTNNKLIETNKTIERSLDKLNENIRKILKTLRTRSVKKREVVCSTSRKRKLIRMLIAKQI